MVHSELLVFDMVRISPDLYPALPDDLEIFAGYQDLVFSVL